VRASIDRRRGGDASSEAPLTVLTPASALAALPQTSGELQGDLAMTLEASPRTLRGGDTVSGTLTLAPTADVSARAVRVELRWRRADNDDECSVVETEAQEQLLAGVDLAGGGSRTLPFSLAVPQGAPPSFEAKHSRLRWTVEGIVDRRGQDDWRVAVPVKVHNA